MILAHLRRCEACRHRVDRALNSTGSVYQICQRIPTEGEENLPGDARACAPGRTSSR